MSTLCGFIQPVALRVSKLCVREDCSRSGPRRTSSYRVMALTEAHRAEEQNFQVRNARGDRLAALLRTPMGAPVGRCMVIAHGFRDNKRGRLVATLSEAMDWTQTIRFDMSGNGESEGPFRFSNYADECEDLRAVILHARSELKLSVDCIVGHSKAGGAVLLYAAKYADVPLVVNVAGRFDMTRGVVERFGKETLDLVEQSGCADVTLRDGFRFKLTKEALHERMNLDMSKVAGSIPISVCVMTIHGAEDRTIPVDDAREFDKLVQNHVLSVVPDASHNFNGKEREVADRIRDMSSRLVDGDRMAQSLNSM